MRHQKHGKTLSRSSAHRSAMFSNMVTSLLQHERIETTDVKAKELRRLAERTITWSVSLGEVLRKDRDKLDAEERARLLHSVRMARRVVRDRDTLTKLFDELGPRYLGRAGGYTRVLKFRQRRGDAAPMSIVELVDREGAEAEESPSTGAKAEKAAPKKEAAPATEKPAKKKPAAEKSEAPAAEKKPRKKPAKDEAEAT